MRLFTPSQTALVLGGGGAKGAYEIGVIAALDELGIRAGSVYGTSVGALNAALYAQGNRDLASELWENMRLHDLIGEDSLAVAEEAEAVYDHPDKLLEFLGRHAQGKSVDVSPFAAMIERCVDEDALRRSGVDMGVVATRFPSLTMVEKHLTDMAPGTLARWLMASAACFPIFPMVVLDEERYLDGGFCDNTPVGMAVRAGARHIIAVDIGRNRSHTQYDARPNVTYIRTAHPLGGLLTLDPALTARNRVLGYQDTLRAFGRLLGFRYAFDPTDAQLRQDLAQDFVVRLTREEEALAPRSALAKGADSAPLFSLLEENLPFGSGALSYLLRALEMLCDLAQINPAQVLTFETLRTALRAQLPFEQAEAMLGSLLGGRIGALFSSPQPDRRLAVCCIYHLLTRQSPVPAIAMHTFAAFPKEYLCALTLQQIL